MTAQAQDLFELKCLLKNINIRLHSRIESGVKQFIAIITSEGDIVLHYTYGGLKPVVKRIPWFTESNKYIQAICFDPSATWLLVVSADSSVYIVPALNLVDKRQKIDCKWSLSDLTTFGRHPQTPNSKPTCVIWWQTLDSNQNALVGYQTGDIALISLTDGRCLGNCTVNEPITDMFLCQDNRLDTVSLLINGESGHQWKLMLEQNQKGYLWPPEASVQKDTTNSVFDTLRKIIVRKPSRDDFFVDLLSNSGEKSKSDSMNDKVETNNDCGLQMLPYMCDISFASHHNGSLFLVFDKSSCLVTVHESDVESAPSQLYRVVGDTNCVLLTDRLIFCVNNNRNLLTILSLKFAESCYSSYGKANEYALIAKFQLNGEKIIQIHKLTDVATVEQKHDDREKNFEFPKTVDDLKIKKCRTDTCILVTNNSVYKIAFKKDNPANAVVDLVLEMNATQARYMAEVFGLTLDVITEQCADLMLGKEAFLSAIILYKWSQVHLLKRVLKLALAADCKTLLRYISVILNCSTVEKGLPTKIHLGNLAVMAYTELILRYPNPVRKSNIKDFMNFLRFVDFYDQVLAVNVACQASNWCVMTLLAITRGLQPEVVSAFIQILKSSRAPKPTDVEFLFALSEPSLGQSLLLNGQSQEILTYIKMNLRQFPVEVLKRFALQLDPSQPTVLSLVRKLVFKKKSSTTSFDTSLDSEDSDNPDRSTIIIKEFIETFLHVLVFLVEKTEKLCYDLTLLEKIDLPSDTLLIESQKMKILPRLSPLSCGYEHAAVVRNGALFTMGLSNFGCLGSGPTLNQNSPLKVVQTLINLKVKVLSVSCGRKHTLVITDYGVYSFGSNHYGQLGLGRFVQESPYPQLITALSSKKIVEVTAGQYHSIALTASGQVYTWGWGIHGQLGHGNCDNCFYPKLLKFDEEIKQVAAGYAHSLILNKNGKLFGYGNNVFGQLDKRDNILKSSTPIWIQVTQDGSLPIIRVATSYFHNVAQCNDNKVYSWGLSPQEVRLLQTKTQHNKNNGYTIKNPECWKESVLIYHNSNIPTPIDQISVGYYHTAILHDGYVYWSKNKDNNMYRPKNSKSFTHICCGLDYTMTLDKNGKLWTWGSPAMTQTAVVSESKMLISKNTKRVIKFPANLPKKENSPVLVSGLPTLAITFKSYDHKLICNKKFIPWSILRIENSEKVDNYIKYAQNKRNFYDDLNYVPNFEFGQKTLHYALQNYFGFYDSENLLLLCLELSNHQAASKIAMLDAHYGDSLAFQLSAFKKLMDSKELDLESKEKDEIKEIRDKNISTSSSLDSIRQWGEDEHQGGCESPCEMSPELGDVRQNITQYLKNFEPITSVSQIVDEKHSEKPLQSELEGYDKTTRDVIETAGKLVEFYIKKIYVSENHILMQNILLKCIEFWLSNSLPVKVLEGILLKNMDKYFYPLSVLLFCKNFSNEDIMRSSDEKQRNSASFLKEFSTKFCLQLCSMVLENVNKA